MKRERVPKEVWCYVDSEGPFAVSKHKLSRGFHGPPVRYVLPSPSTVEKRLRDAVVRAAMKNVEKYDDKQLEFWAKSGSIAGEIACCARLELHLRATRKDAR